MSGGGYLSSDQHAQGIRVTPLFEACGSASGRARPIGLPRLIACDWTGGHLVRMGVAHRCTWSCVRFFEVHPVSLSIGTEGPLLSRNTLCASRLRRQGGSLRIAYYCT